MSGSNQAAQPQIQHQLPSLQPTQMQQQPSQLDQSFQQQTHQPLPPTQQQLQPQQLLGQWQAQRRQSPMISQAQQQPQMQHMQHLQHQQPQMQVGGTSSSGAGLQSSLQMQLANVGMTQSQQHPQHSLFSGNDIQGLRGSAALQGGFPGSVSGGPGSLQSASAVSSLPQYYTGMPNSGNSALSG